jgi:hypothetical protein
MEPPSSSQIEKEMKALGVPGCSKLSYFGFFFGIKAFLFRWCAGEQVE